jgi:D-alanyl-lipoteichoic acid acyltransferase DltB (MBOAT superfamily)
MLLVASCIFYSAWDWRFLFLIFVSLTTDYLCSLKIHASDNEKRRKFFLVLSILINLSILGVFKYFNFFVSSLKVFLGCFGLNIHPIVLQIALPIGISFYTLKTMSYTIDVYTRKIEPTRSYLDYFLFVIFFPLLLSGPIMRAEDLLPQIASPRKLRLDWFYEGCYLIFWGLFQKIFIADNLAKIVDFVFNAPAPYNGVQVLLTLYAFAFQIYCDFAGYSNIARGLGRCMGFDIIINFNLPYFATNPQEFWKRWHISLSTWLHDYLYTPIAFSKRSWGNWGVVFALMATFILCGLWHGAAWTFVIWGAYQGMLLVIHRFLKPLFELISSPKSIMNRRIRFIIKVIFFFHLACLGWLIFRAHSVGQSLEMLQALVFNFKFSKESFGVILNIIALICILLIVQVFQFIKKDQLFIFKQNWMIRAAFYYVIFYLILIFGVANGREFVYFRF